MASKQKLIGVDLGGTTIKFAILTTEGEVQQKWSQETNVLAEGSLIIPDIIESINHHLDLYNMSAEEFMGIGMGTPGGVNRADGSVSGAFNLNWDADHKVYPVRDITEQTGIQTYLENDANVAALGERWKGAGNNAKDVVFVTLGTGVGGGIITNGKLVTGIAGGGGEIGHVTIDPDGYECNCGKKGCLETVASATGIVRVARDLAEQYAGNSKLKSMLDNGDDISAKDVYDLAKEDDVLALQVVDKVSMYLGIALANQANSLNPEFIIVGGGVSAAGDFLLEHVNKYFLEYTFPLVRRTTKLKLATLGNGAGVIGAASLVINEGE
ncbi:glucokinase [Companilactobacillus sp. RD055328]|uniref:ROK family glucokinase n=1 Tax=Companilactobacillus sp. RD055328 TaxID=2916634 RepID=UPI001FC7ECDC|nr:ROK family glucokinase [Companilactobacillus sp. RD055328]GKQ42538.1 glucokinase [Companilactobacillus sp. RD055328]